MHSHPPTTRPSAVVIAGRIDQQVKLRGLRIEIGEVEVRRCVWGPGAEVVDDPRHGSGCLEYWYRGDATSAPSPWHLLPQPPWLLALVCCGCGGQPVGPDGGSCAGRHPARLLLLLPPQAALAAIPGVELAAAAVLSDPHGQQRLVGYLQPCGATSEEGAQAAVGQQLPQYMVPSLVVQLAALPRLPNGKLDRGALPAPDWGSSAGSGGGGGGAPPATPLEEAVARIFQEVIGCAEALGAEDDFFLVGGTSLLTGEGSLAWKGRCWGGW